MDNPTRSEILNAEFLPLMKVGLRAVAVLLPFICLMEGLAADDLVDWAIFSYDFGISLFILAAAVVLAQRPPSPRWAHPFSFLIVVLLQISILLTLHFQRDLTETSNVGVVMVSTGFLFLSTPWFAAYLVLAAGSWAATTHYTFGAEADIFGTHSIYAATVAAIVIHWTRVNTTLRLYRLNKRDEEHRIELAAALDEAKKEIEKRQAVEANLVTRLEIERLASTISSRFVVAETGEIDDAINRALEDLGAHTGIDRIVIFSFNPSLTHYSCRYEWHSESLPTLISRLQDVPVERFPWISSYILKGELLNISDVRKLPPEASSERAAWEIMGIVGTLMFPFRRHPEPPGFVAFDSVRSHKQWSDSEVSLLGLIAEILISAMERRDSEEALAASEARYRLIADNSLDVIWTVDARFRPIYATPSIRDLLGYTYDEIIELGGHRETLDPESARSFHFNSIQDAVDYFERLQPGEMIELKFIHKEGHPVWTESSIKVLRDADGTLLGVQGTTRDITPRRKIEEEKRGLEDQLLQSQKMEAVGTLAGGIAHDFNNLLTGILGYSNALKLDNEPGTKTFEAADVIERAAERAAQLTRQLLGFARKGKFQNTRIDIQSTIQEVITLLTRTLNKNIEIESRLGSPDRAVSGDPTQIQQVILNIAVNARDAMPEGGTLSFRTQPVDFGSDHPAPGGLADGPYVCIRIADTGRGIEESIRSRIFEPFFTTKEMGKGTGMGLATAYGIVKNHGGLIRVESEEGRGSTFEILLPAFSEPVSKSAKSPDTHPERKRSVRILLIDDEAIVCDIATALLERLGHTVESFTDPEQGVAVFRKGPERFDLALLDIIMPKMDGLACMRELQRIRPDVRILLSSGFEQDGAVNEAIAEGALGFIQKPYKLKILARAVGAALDAPAAVAKGAE